MSKHFKNIKEWSYIKTMQLLLCTILVTKPNKHWWLKSKMADIGTMSCPVMFNHKSLNFNGYKCHWRVIFSTLWNCPTVLYWKHGIFNNFLFMSCSTWNWISGMVVLKWCLKPLAELIHVSCCLIWKIAYLNESSIHSSATVAIVGQVVTCRWRGYRYCMGMWAV